MFKKFLDLLVSHVKAELVAWAEAEIAQHLVKASEPVEAPAESQG